MHSLPLLGLLAALGPPQAASQTYTYRCLSGPTPLLHHAEQHAANDFRLLYPLHHSCTAACCAALQDVSARSHGTGWRYPVEKTINHILSIQCSKALQQTTLLVFLWARGNIRRLTGNKGYSQHYRDSNGHAVVAAVMPCRTCWAAGRGHCGQCGGGHNGCICSCTHTQILTLEMGLCQTK